jgi:hypothetical protein
MLLVRVLVPFGDIRTNVHVLDMPPCSCASLDGPLSLPCLCWGLSDRGDKFPNSYRLPT